MTAPKRDVVVIGAGLGGISAAISLAQKGYPVAVYEKNDRIGGKLNLHTEQGYTFDLGPSILTLPHYFQRLFERSGKDMADYIPLRPLRPHWRNFFEDGTVVNLFPEEDRMREEADKLDPALYPAVRSFLAYCARQYDTIERGYFEKGLDTVGEFVRFYEPTVVFKFDFLRTMHRAVSRRIPNRYLRDIFDFFAKYVGSSPYDAPAMMNCLPTIQFRYDLWYVDGGMYNIAVGLGKLMSELGIAVHLDSEVTEIRRDGDRVSGVVINGTDVRDAGIVVSNMEVIPAYERLLKEDRAFLRRLEKFEPACSGLVLDLGLDCKYDQLAHHNFFFSGSQKDHFDSVFHKKVLPEDPTVYLVAASQTDPTVAPAGCDCLKILPHIPYIQSERPYEPSDYEALKNRLLDKLERMGLTDLRKHVVVEHMWTPHDIRERYYSNRGSIYGVVSDLKKNMAFKAPKQSTRYANLFFAGGSVNPGAGMPMVILCGQNVAEKVAQWDRA